VQQANFNDYRMLRLPGAPEVEVHFVEPRPHYGSRGAGYAADCAGGHKLLANAVFATTGARLQSLPFARSRL
jgi:isoquinoline 1-oxidoreductase subunit beta